MFRNIILAVVSAAALSTAAFAETNDEAKAVLEKAVAALKADKVKAFEMFSKGEGGFKILCANASDGIITAHPMLRGKQLKDLKDETGFAFGAEIMREAAEGKITDGKVTEVTKC